jgi:predicted nucleic acid-binding protein
VILREEFRTEFAEDAYQEVLNQKSEVDESQENVEIDEYREEFAYAEFLLLAEKYGIDRVRAISNLLEMVPVVPEDHSQAVLKAAKYQKEHGMTTFDALHSELAETRGARILSLEKDSDSLDIERVRLEKGGED